MNSLFLNLILICFDRFVILKMGANQTINQDIPKVVIVLDIKIRLYSITHRTIDTVSFPVRATVSDLYRKFPCHEFMLTPGNELGRNSTELLDPEVKYYSISRLPSGIGYL